ncbi:hypothetical protein Bhyg_15798 [Pseudolycoriella hygida]|uniref:Uncharacterized protein n=1 Tax=Pseudolycoriella hygida TaxID=35572 RepID=A0A9Q0MLM1_9DIPT|nr:hypothetical protein Bhyg_15798 [Pseudolycoriella hygida]
MLKLMVIVGLFAIPAISQQYWSRVMSGLLPLYYDCENNTVQYNTCIKDDDSGGDDKLKQEVYSTAELVINTTVFARNSSSTFSNEQITTIRQVSQRYCPIVERGLNCLNDSLSNCTNLDLHYTLDTIRRFVNFFCENESYELIRLLDAVFFKCPEGPAKKKFAEDYGVCVINMFKTVTGIHDPITKTGYCMSVDTGVKCIATVLQGCTSSEGIVDVLTSFQLYLRKRGICSTIG